MPLAHAVERRREIAQEVEAIGDLDRLGRALLGPIRIGPGPVAADELDSRMHAEPRRHGGRLAIRQEVDHPMALEVDQHCPVALAPAPGPVVDAEHARGRAFGGGRIANAGEERRRPDREAETVGQVGTRAAA